MFRCECECKRFCVYRKRQLKTWNRVRCKICNSHNKVFFNNELLYDYNYMFPKIMKPIDISKKMATTVTPKVVISQNSPVKPKKIIKNDVFLGYDAMNELMMLDEYLYENIKNIFEDDEKDKIEKNIKIEKNDKIEKNVYDSLTYEEIFNIYIKV